MTNYVDVLLYSDWETGVSSQVKGGMEKCFNVSQHITFRVHFEAKLIVLESRLFRGLFLWKETVKMAVNGSAEDDHSSYSARLNC